MDTTLFPKTQNEVCNVLVLLSRMESPVKGNFHAGFGPADEGLSTPKKLAASASSDWNIATSSSKTSYKIEIKKSKKQNKGQSKRGAPQRLVSDN